jgi:hypothetical protein
MLDAKHWAFLGMVFHFGEIPTWCQGKQEQKQNVGGLCGGLVWMPYPLHYYKIGFASGEARKRREGD